MEFSSIRDVDLYTIAKILEGIRIELKRSNDLKEKEISKKDVNLTDVIASIVESP